MSQRKTIIIKTFKTMLNERGIEAEDKLFDEDFVLLNSGLDSLGFAVMVARLEEEFDFDPFIETESPVYPRTFFEFLNIYEQK